MHWATDHLPSPALVSGTVCHPAFVTWHGNILNTVKNLPVCLGPRRWCFWTSASEMYITIRYDMIRLPVCTVLLALTDNHFAWDLRWWIFPRLIDRCRRIVWKPKCDWCKSTQWKIVYASQCCSDVPLIQCFSTILVNRNPLQEFWLLTEPVSF